MSAKQDTGLRSLTARGAATRSRIVSAAADLIYVHGVDRTSLDEVMAVSGVSKSQLYHYFADKDALVLAVIALQTERVLSAQQPHLGALDSLRALQLWRDALVRLNTSTGTRGCPLGSLASELVNDSSSARKRVAAGFEVWNDSIERGLTKMRERGASGNLRRGAGTLACRVGTHADAPSCKRNSPAFQRRGDAIEPLRLPRRNN